MKNEKKNTGSKSFLVFGLVIAALLAVVIVGIELARRSGGGAANNRTEVAENSADKPFPREIKDAAGESFVISEKPRRIVSQTLGTDEILLNICAPERVVAFSSLAEDANSSNVVDLAKSVPNRTMQGAEQILQMQPDLIFVASYSRAETVDLLKASKAPVFRFANFTSIDDIKNNIRTVGYATGCDTEAEKLIAKMTQDLAAIRSRIPAADKPLRVMSFGGGYTAGANTTFNDMVRSVGAVNISAENGIDGFSKISAEKIADWQPDFIVAGANPGELESKKNQLLADPIIASSKAGKAGHVIVIDNRHYLTVSQFVVKGVEDLFNGLYGSENLK